MRPYRRKSPPAAPPRRAPTDAPRARGTVPLARRCLAALGYLWLTRTLYLQGIRLGERLRAPPPPVYRPPPARRRKRTPPPTLAQMERDRHCTALFASERPLYSGADWRRLRAVWRGQDGTPVEYEAGDTRVSSAAAGFRAPVAAGQTADGKGRGLFAVRDFLAGERTAGGMDSYIYFHTGRAYRRFVGALDDGEACDVLRWTWPEPDIGRWGGTLLVLELGDGSLLNDGGNATTNCGCPEGVHCGKYDEYALRNISQGEELLVEYDRFYPEYPGELWSSFGL